MKRAGMTTLVALLLPTALLGGALVQMGSLNLGQLLCWLAFFSSLGTSPIVRPSPAMMNTGS